MKTAPIADDPRVRKQGDALVAAGHDVVALGTAGGRSSAPAWPVVSVPAPKRSPQAKAAAGARLAVAGRIARAALPLYWTFAENRALAAELERVLAAGRADAVVANDWRVLPLAAEAAAAHGAALVYDSHELATEEFLERRLWRWVFPAWIRELETAYIGRAAAVTTVSEGIADLLHQRYRLDRRPEVIRNVPPYTPSSFRPTGAIIEVLYQGMFIESRGLEALIASVPAWRPEFRLTIRGMGKPAYERRIRSLVAASPAAGRIRVEPPVPMVDMVAAAEAADIGIHPLQITSNQMLYTLPNKLFEYLMAGLAVCVTGAPEMARVVRERGVGTVIDAPTASGIAAAVNRFDRDSVDRAKRAALHAAADLHWGREQQRWVAQVEAAATVPAFAATR